MIFYSSQINFRGLMVKISICSEYTHVAFLMSVCNICEMSCPFNMKEYSYERDNMPYSFLIRSDGGHDRNPRNASVQIGCIYNFLQNDLDFVIYLITAPDVSHVNEVEGVMPVANIALQNQAYCRETMSHEMEYKF